MFSVTEGLLNRGSYEIRFGLISLCTLKFDYFVITIYYFFAPNSFLNLSQLLVNPRNVSVVYDVLQNNGPHLIIHPKQP